MLHCSLRALALTALLALCACGGSGGGSPPAFDLTGYWQLFLTPSGAAEVGPLPFHLTQTGATFDGVDLSGSMSGTSLTLTADGGTFTISLAGTASSANAAQGNVTLAGSVSGSGTFRLERYQPTGTANVSGTLGGIALNLSSTTATGIRKYSNVGLSTMTAVTVALIDRDFDIQIDLSPTGLTVGTLTLPTNITAEVLCRNDTAIVSATVTSGTVTITSYSTSGIAGSYSLTTAEGTITGAFDVTFDLESYDP